MKVVEVIDHIKIYLLLLLVKHTYITYRTTLYTYNKTMKQLKSYSLHSFSSKRPFGCFLPWRGSMFIGYS